MKKAFLLIISCICSILGMRGQDIVFSNLSIADGLLHTYVNDIYQDENGYIWIGSYKGVSLYNGGTIQNFKPFENTFNRTHSVFVKSICGNRKGKIFIAYEDIISEYNIADNSFKIILRIGKINTTFYDKKLYIGQENRILTYDEENENFELLFVFPDPKLEVSELFIDTHNRLWIGTTAGLFRMDNPGEAPLPILEKSVISCIWQDSQNNLWVGTWEEGFYIFESDTIKQYKNEIKNENSLSSGLVRTICEDDNGHFWIGTDGGLNKFDKIHEKFTRYYEDDKNGGLTSSSIWRIIKDEQGTIWIGTYFGGINYFNPKNNIYTYYRASGDEKQGLSSKVVGRIVCDKDENLWIATEGGGLNSYNPANNTFKWYRHNSLHSNSISGNNIKAMYYDRKGHILWIGTHLGGLNKLDVKTKKFTHYKSIPEDSTTLSNNIIRTIIPYRDSLIIGTHEGVNMFSPATGKCRHLFKDKRFGQPQVVSDLYIDKDSTLWFTFPGHGVYSYCFDTQEVIHYQHNTTETNTISDHSVNNIYQDREGYIWFSTSNHGIDRFDPESSTFENFNTLNSNLISDCVYTITESPYSGKLYIVTNRGLVSFEKENRTFYFYSTIPLQTLNENAIYIKPDGEIFLGGVNGMVSFFEKDLMDDELPTYKIIPYGLSVDNKMIEVGDESGILKTPLLYNPNIRFQCQHSFSIYFSTTDYISPNGNNIVYKLIGFSDKWNETNGYNIISYTNLRPGNYSLILKAQTNDGIDIDEKRINIHILPPYYRSNIALCLYVLLITIVLFFIIRSYNNRIRLKESLKYEKKRIQDIEELNQYKLDFFTSISHELRTPLTIISGQIEMILKGKEVVPKVEKRLFSIQNVIRQMYELISELLDFRKQEKNQFQLHVVRQNIVPFVNDIAHLYKEYAASQRKTLFFSTSDENIEVWFDPKQMQKVMNNLLSNAFKYTSENETIHIHIQNNADTVTIRLEDKGEGISKEDIYHIFESFYQSKEAKSGTGIGLALVKNIIELHGGSIEVESEKGVKTIFTIILQKGHTHFTTEQLIMEDSENVTNYYDIVLPVSEVEYSSPESIPPTTKILIVEDNTALRKMLDEVFSPVYTVFTAPDGKKGLEAAIEQQPDIIVSDVVMPFMSGIEMCSQLKNNLDTSHIPVVLLTARSEIEHTIEGLHSGADDYITKPFNVHILLHKCNGLVRNRIKLKEKFSRQPQEKTDILATNRLDKEFMEQVTHLIEENISNPDFNIDDLTKQLAIARTNVYAKIKAISGQTPNKFILMVRMKKASHLLKNEPRQTITEIAYSVGFSSVRYFNKCFKDMYHITPAQFRESAG